MARYGDVRVTYNHFGAIAARLPAAVGKIVRRTANDVERRAKVAIQSGHKTGKTYARSTTGKRRVHVTVHDTTTGAKRREWTGQRQTVTTRTTHRASAPGEAPATDTGELVNSISVEMTRQTEALVMVDAEYGAALEYGTARVAARPFLTPAAEGARAAFVRDMQKLEGELR